MSGTIPDGWEKVKLGEVCLPVPTTNPSESPDTVFTYFDIGGIDNINNRIFETKTHTGRNIPGRARQLVRKGDILFSTVRTNLKNIAIIENDYSNPVASTGFAVIRPAEGMSSQFLFYQLLTKTFLDPLNELQTGTSYPAVRSSDVFAQPILLPPTREQEQIASYLNDVFSNIRIAQSASSRAQYRLKEYRNAILRSAFTGELTSEWRLANNKAEMINSESSNNLLQRYLEARRKSWERAELKYLVSTGRNSKDQNWKNRYPEPSVLTEARFHKIPDSWTLASVDQLSIVVRGASPRPAGDPRYFGGHIPWITVGSLTNDSQIYLTKTLETLSEAGEKESRYIEVNTLLLTNSGATLGVPKITKIGGCINDGVAALLHVDESLKIYLYYFLLSQTEVLREISQGAAQPNLNTGIIRGIVVPIPPPEEQAEIVNIVEQRLIAAEQLYKSLEGQLKRSYLSQDSLLHEAFRGGIYKQDPKDEPASALIKRIREQKTQEEINSKFALQSHRKEIREKEKSMLNSIVLTPDMVGRAWEKIDQAPNARRLFSELGLGPEQVELFYDVLRTTKIVKDAFRKESLKHRKTPRVSTPTVGKSISSESRFRLVELWLEDFKNLKDYHVRFDPEHGLDVLLGWNGTGKSNLFESLIVIFRDLNEWCEKNRWPSVPMKGYRFRYEIDLQIVEVTWNPKLMKRPELKKGSLSGKESNKTVLNVIKRNELPLPRFVFGYYSGPTNRLSEHFLPMKQSHYVRLREAKSDNAKTLADLLEQRKFFCAETHHAKYVLLAFCYKDDPKITKFLNERLRIVGFESALFIIRQPGWARSGEKSDTFWGAKGVMRRVLERLRQFSIAPMVIEHTINDGYRTKKEAHYYFFLPDLQSLHAFAGEYEDARTFFLALESTDFSELIYDVKIQVKVKSADSKEVPVTFREMSEGEQQLLMVLGLMRFTKSHQSLVLLDEPDTHLNPHWSIDYLKLLTQVMSDDDKKSDEQQTSQILISTHNPLVIASLVKEQIHLLKRSSETLQCYWEQPNEDPRGLGFTGILISDIFGFRSDLDEETLSLLDRQVSLATNAEPLSQPQRNELKSINAEVERLGFKSISSDPYYRAFIEALVRREEILALAIKPIQSSQEKQVIRDAADEILARLSKAHPLKP